MAREDNFWIGLEVRRRRGFTDNTGEWCGAWWDKEREGVYSRCCLRTRTWRWRSKEVR